MKFLIIDEANYLTNLAERIKEEAKIQCSVCKGSGLRVVQTKPCYFRWKPNECECCPYCNGTGER